MKKGISPLLAISILVGFVIVLSIVILNFFSFFSGDKIDNIENEELVESICGQLSLLDFEFCKSGPSSIYGSIRNEGDYKIVNFESEFKFFNESAGALKVDSSDVGSIEPFGFAGFDALGFGSGPGPPVPNFGRINELRGFFYIKEILYLNETIVCPGIVEPISPHELEVC